MALAERSPAPLGDDGRLTDPRLEATAVAWLLVLPAIVVGVLLALLLGPPLGELLFPPASFAFLPNDPEPIQPEPLEGSRYLLAIAAALLLPLATVATVRLRRPHAFPRAAQLTIAAQCAVVSVLALCMVLQRTARWGVPNLGATRLLAAAGVTCVLLAALRYAPLRRVAPARGTRWGSFAAALAATATALWVLPGVNTEASIAWGYGRIEGAFPFDEAFAVLNGLTPWVDFNVQYAALVPFLVAPALLLLGKTVLVYTLAMCALTALALLAVFGVFRRVTGSSIAALALYLPFLGMSLHASPAAPSRFTAGTYFGMLPLRYVGPYLLAWLLARTLERPQRRAWPVLFAGGLVMVNNADFGVVALVATLAALLWTAPDRAARLAREAALGVGGALLLYALLALVRSGGLPDPARALRYARLYGAAGYSAYPLPGVLGLPLVLFATYAAAIATATTRALESSADRVLTGMLVWSGLFGLGAGAYYVTRSSATVLPFMFSAWTLSLMLLAVVVARQQLAAPRRIPRPASLAVLFGVALAVGSIVQVPAPWSQLERMRKPTPPLEPVALEWAARPTQDPAVRAFVAAIGDGPGRFVVRAGAPVGLFATTGHRIADAYDVVDAIPYTGPQSIHTVEQREEAFDALRDAGGNTALIAPDRLPLLLDGLLARGFALLTASGPRRRWEEAQTLPADALVVGGFTKWVDTRRPHAPWLQRE